jgi:transcriptional regulator with XRE-family HTH domain
MRIIDQMTDEQILAELGNRLVQLRLEKNLTQADLAQQAGVGVRTVQRLEAGAIGTQLSGFLRVGRILGLVDRLEVFIPEAQESPMALLKRQGKTRQRASGQTSAPEHPRKWTWEDDS